MATTKRLTKAEKQDNQIKLLEQELRASKQAGKAIEDQYLKLLSQHKVLTKEVEALPPPRRLPSPTKGKAKEVSALLTIGDWHAGLVVKPDEVNNYNVYSSEVLEERINTLLEQFVQWTDIQRKGYRINEVYVVGLGDMIDGSIHLENQMFNEMAPPKQATYVGDQIAKLLAGLAEHYPKVKYHGLNTDNHSRLTRKPLYTGRGLWSWGAVAHAVCEARLANHKKVSVVDCDNIKMELSIRGKEFLFEHGNDLKAWNGIPYYGIKRLKAQEQMRRAKTKRGPFDYLVMGHWHTFYLEDDCMINPSMCGTTPYDHAVGRHSPPGQTCMLVGDRGWFNHLRIDL